MDRRATFSALSTNFNVTQPWRGFDELYAAQPWGSAGEEVARSLSLDARGHHVLIGAIGSGKSTELYRAWRGVHGDRGLLAFIEDADLLGDGLTSPRPGLLAERVGEALVQNLEREPLRLPEIALQAADRIRRRGRRVAEGLLAGDDLDPTSADPWSDLKLLRGAFPETTPVAFLDSLDRVRSISEYLTLLEHDLPRLGELDICVVMTGPIDLLFGVARERSQVFRELHVVRTLDPSRDAHARFLDAVLGRRDVAGLFMPDARTRMIADCGGHLRHLIALGFAAVRAAQRGTGEAVTLKEATEASRRVAEEVASGLLPQSWKALEEIVSGAPLTVEEASLVGLIRTARVFETEPGAFRVHPLLRERVLQKVA